MVYYKPDLKDYIGLIHIVEYNLGGQTNVKHREQPKFESKRKIRSWLTFPEYYGLFRFIQSKI